MRAQVPWRCDRLLSCLVAVTHVLVTLSSRNMRMSATSVTLLQIIEAIAGAMGEASTKFDKLLMRVGVFVAGGSCITRLTQ